jgi:uncharacterized membrane protein YfcA
MQPISDNVLLVNGLQISGLANSTGVGGGFFWAPLFNALLGFSVKASTAMSQPLVAGGSVGATLFSITMHHPKDRGKPLIDYDLATVLLPALMLGVSFGVFLNTTLPTLILASLLFVALILIAVRVLHQGIRRLKAERKAAAEPEPIQPEVKDKKDSGEQASSSINTEENKGHEAECVAGHSLSPSPAPSPSQRPGRLVALWRKMYKPEILPKIPILILFVVTGTYLGFQVGKGQYSHCDWQYAVLFSAEGLLMITLSASVLSYHYRRTSGQRNNTVNSHEGEMSGLGTEAAQSMAAGAENTMNRLSQSMVRLLIVWFVAIVIGLVATMLGLGGGVFMSPIMIEMGVYPQSAAATSTLIVLFSSLAAAITYGVTGRLNLSYVAVLTPLCMAGGFFGVFVLRWAIKRLRTASLITFVMGGLILVSAGLIAGFGLRESIVSVAQGNGLHVTNFCSGV